MTAIAADDFDRVGATLGSGWDLPTASGVGTWNADGDRAVNDDVSQPDYFALSAGPRPVNTYGIDADYSVKVMRADEQDGTFKAGLVFSSVSAANWTAVSTSVRRAFLCYYDSSSGEVKLDRLNFDGTSSNFLTSSVSWGIGEFHTIRVNVRPDTGIPQRGIYDVYADGVLLGMTNIFTATTTGADHNYSGMYSFRTPDAATPWGLATVIAAGSQRPDVGKFDLFRVSDDSLATTVETEPTLATDPTLTTIALAGEGATEASLSIEPDSAYVVDRAWATNRLMTTSGHMVRHARLSQARRFWRFSWRARNTADKDTLVSFFDARNGAVDVFDWTPPGGSDINMAYVESSLSVAPSPGGTEEIWDLEAVTVEIL